MTAMIGIRNDETPSLRACEQEKRGRPKHLQRHPCNNNTKCPFNPCLHNGHWNVNNVGRVPGRPRECPRCCNSGFSTLATTHSCRTKAVAACNSRERGCPDVSCAGIDGHRQCRANGKNGAFQQSVSWTAGHPKQPIPTVPVDCTS